MDHHRMCVPESLTVTGAFGCRQRRQRLQAAGEGHGRPPAHAAGMSDGHLRGKQAGSVQAAAGLYVNSHPSVGEK